MNTLSNSNVPSREGSLKRAARTYRQPSAPIHRSASLKAKQLHIIPEEEEPRASSSMASYAPSTSTGHSQTKGLKARRRHANITVSEIKVTRHNLVDDISEQNMLESPRPAPRPPTPSPKASPDSFRLTFTDISFRFPHPPIPTPSSLTHERQSPCSSPTPSMSSSSSSCSPFSNSSGLPMTPSSSDDEFFAPSQRVFNPRRPSIKPLTITKRNSLSTSPLQDVPISASLLQPFKNELEQIPVPALFSEEESSNDDEPESDSEWYTREFSKILTLVSPMPQSFPSKNTRPESMAVSARPPSSPRTPASPLVGYPSGQLDPAFPRRTRSRRIPKHAPPPVPTIPAHFRSLSTEMKSPPADKALPPRPPPRFSVPADFVFDDEDASVFSFSIYDNGLETPSDYSQSSFPSSAGAQSVSFPVDDLQFDVDIDYPMMLPLSLPTSPLDLEADIASGLEELRMRDPPLTSASASATAFILQGIQEEAAHTEAYSPVQPQPQPHAQSFEDDFTWSPTPSVSGSGSAERGLKSKWSSSTLGSIRDQHEARGASAKLRLYFNNSPLKQKRASGNAKKTTPPTPTSPSGMKKVQRGVSQSDGGHGYSQQGGLRRRGSVTPTVSDAGSVESSSSTGSNGLRRKPIPVKLLFAAAE